MTCETQIAIETMARAIIDARTEGEKFKALWEQSARELAKAERELEKIKGEKEPKREVF